MTKFPSYLMFKFYISSLYDSSLVKSNPSPLATFESDEIAFVRAFS